MLGAVRVHHHRASARHADSPGRSQPTDTPGLDASHHYGGRHPYLRSRRYKLYYGLASRQYSFRKTLGPQTTYGLAGLVPERTYYVAVTAYDRTGTESGLSEEITVVVPPRAQHMPTLMQEALRHGQPTQFSVTWARPGEVVSFLFSAIGEGVGPCAAETGRLVRGYCRPGALWGSDGG